MPYSDLIRQMTLTEKALLLTGKNLWETQAIPRLGVPAVVMSDGSYGLRREMPGQEKKLKRRCHPATCFPVGAALGSSWDVQLMQRVGEALGAEAAALDVDILLGPGMNVKRTPLCGRSFEYYSEDPYLTGKLAAAMIRGIQSRGVLACPKHFACNSQEDGRMANDAIVDEKTLREIYLTAFEIAVREGRPGALMTSYNLVNGTYAGEHPHLLGDILRGEWGYEGMVVSDWGAGVHHVEAVRAGATLDMPGPGAADVCALIEAVKSGALPEETLDRRVEELLRVAMREKPARRNVDFPAHHALARQAAAESIVLLKNDGGLLPLRADVALVYLGLSEKKEAEGLDRTTLALTKNQLRLLAALARPLRGAALRSPLRVGGGAGHGRHTFRQGLPQRTVGRELPPARKRPARAPAEPAAHGVSRGALCGLPLLCHGQRAHGLSLRLQAVLYRICSGRAGGGGSARCTVCNTGKRRGGGAALHLLPRPSRICAETARLCPRGTGSWREQGHRFAVGPRRLPRL